MNERAFRFFLEFHRGLLREGPGSDAATTEAFREHLRWLGYELYLLQRDEHRSS